MMNTAYIKPITKFLRLATEKELLSLSIDTSTAEDGNGNSEWGAKESGLFPTETPTPSNVWEE